MELLKAIPGTLIHFVLVTLFALLIALITYCLGPLTELQPIWVVLIVVVTVLIFAELKESFISLSRKLGKDEFFTLAKFLIITGGLRDPGGHLPGHHQQQPHENDLRHDLRR